jgi:hypothetical protein
MDGFDEIEKIFPVIVFFIWIIFGVLMKGARKRSDAPPVSPSQKKDGRQPEKTESRPGNLKKRIQMVLEEIQLSGEQPEVEPVIQEGPKEPLPEYIPEAEVVLHSSPAENRKSPEEKQNDVYSVSGLPKTGKITRETLRQGFIWSEIIAPPLAFRNDPDILLRKSF